MDRLGAGPHLTPPRYAELTADGAPLAQEPPPVDDARPTLCLACGLPLAGVTLAEAGAGALSCACGQLERAEAVRVLHAALTEGRDPAAALTAWRDCWLSGP